MSSLISNNNKTNNKNNNKNNNNKNNNNNVNPNVNNLNKSVMRKLNELNKLININSKGIFNYNKLLNNKYRFINNKIDGLKTAYADYRDNVLADYIYGIFHPDIVFKENLNIKSPSYLPVPTTSFRFKETITLQPNSRGNFVIYWYPNFLGTQTVLNSMYDFYDNCNYSLVYFNNDEYLSGQVKSEGNWKAFSFRSVSQDFQKYRLTSACIKVKYTGQVIQQSGMLAAAASYAKSYITLAGRLHDRSEFSEYEVPPEFTPPLGMFTDFDNIRQGQWAQTCSLVNEPDGITCTYVPTDPLNQVFVDNGTTIDQGTSEVITGEYMKTIGWLPKNANISYAICGYGIQSDSPCITIETYYNFEIIVRQEQYPYFNPTSGEPKLMRNVGLINSIQNMLTVSGLISKTKNHDNNSVWTKIRNAFKKASNTYKDVFPYISAISKLLV